MTRSTTISARLLLWALLAIVLSAGAAAESSVAAVLAMRPDGSSAQVSAIKERDSLGVRAARSATQPRPDDDLGGWASVSPAGAPSAALFEVAPRFVQMAAPPRARLAASAPLRPWLTDLPPPTA